uniref:Uncharacterized protein n=1 Tax=Anopheles atroparvus TaxID=41427 RepID=A0A182INE7_ANOAO
MRLQLKLEKNDLKRQVAALTHQARKGRTDTKLDADSTEAPQDQQEPIEVNTSIDDPSAVKFCESCTKQYNIYDSMKHCKACIFRHSFSYCDRCVGQLKMNFDDGQPQPADKDTSRDRFEELERQYLTVLEENENLRMGMHEILEKLREYDSMSDQLTIDRSMLEKLLSALDARPAGGWYQTGMRLQGDVLSARERDLLLKDRLAMGENGADGRKSKSVQSTESVNDSGNVCNEDDNSEPIEPLPGPEQLDFSEQVLLRAVEIDRLTEALEELRADNGRLLGVQDELRVTQKQYNELLNITKASENEKDRLLVEAVDRLKDIESAVCIFQRKVDYLKTDNDNLHNTLRTIKSEYLNVLHDLRLELAQKSNQLNAEVETTGATAGDSLDSTGSEQIEKLETELARLKLEATNFYSIFLKNIAEVDKEQLLDMDYTKLSQFAVVDTNLAVEFITKDEHRRTRDRLEKLERELQREVKKNRHLEELLQVSSEQIRSQQSLISKHSEDEVNLRHLVVDLQSASNEQYLLARAHKELDVGECIFVLQQN